MAAIYRPYHDSDADPLVLDADMNRLVQYVGPTPAQAPHPEHGSSRIQARRTGRRDDELSPIDRAHMTPAGRAGFVSHLVRTARLELAVEKFPNLSTLTDEEIE